MSYTAKRVILLLMAWGLLVFAGVTIRINMNTPPVAGFSATPTPLAGPADSVDRALELQRALEANPNDLAAMTELAGLFYDDQDWPSALLLYERAATLDPHNVDILVHQAACQLYTQQFGVARQTLDQAGQLAPRRADIHLLLGLAASRQSPPDSARANQEWHRVLELAPGTDLARQAQALLDGAARPQQ
ncbi:MAG TPA: tetratricopeptide repeat protein [Chloroflexia bacterium]|nr:tetratricopeptide repeat protein [Chloroflexia bacterium]